MTGRHVVHGIPVSGGTLTVGEWSGGGAPVLALHGITAHHLAWALVADALPDRRVIAPDLRGRGRSRSLPGPGGLAQHADDAARVLRKLTRGPAVVVGHSMGAFVALVLADRHPDLVARLVLVDGGLPFAAAEQSTTEAALAAIRARLEARWSDEAAYVDVFRRHPAFVDEWSHAAADYAAYDAVRVDDGAGGHVTASADLQAVLADQADILAGDSLRPALEGLVAARRPTSFLHATRGFADDPPGLYAAETVVDLQRQFPRLSVRRVDDVNHYTVLLSTRGASAVAAATRDV